MVCTSHELTVVFLTYAGLGIPFRACYIMCYFDSTSVMLDLLDRLFFDPSSFLYPLQRIKKREKMKRLVNQNRKNMKITTMDMSIVYVLFSIKCVQGKDTA